MVVAAIVLVSIVFGLFHLVPGDPAVLIAGESAPMEVVEAVRKAYGFDAPIYVQYVRYLSKLLHGDLGVSVYNKVPVIRLVVPRFLNTLQLAGLAMLFAVLAALPLGSAAAIHRGHYVDRLITGGSILGLSTPVFISGLAVMYVFCVKLRILPLTGMQSWRGYILPVGVFGLYQMGFLTRMVRACMVESLQMDCIRTARAKGLPESWVVYRHALKNAMPPVVTIIGLRFGYTLGGAVVTETIFTWPGLGRLMVNSILTRDLPVTQGSILVFGLSFITLNLLVDILYGILDPRVQYA